ncbi:MAG: tetratricopeptide repeat protein [Alphaproteobacteria bacterium]|nr:MAG: tetratricopeptide repeat protein [Alphaproteobacteria bacterium]
MLFRLLLIIMLALPGAALAVGGGGGGGSGSGSGGGAGGSSDGGDGDRTAPPKTTNTSKECADGEYFDWSSKTCKKPREQGSVDDDILYRAVRELAYAGRHESSLMLIAAMSEEAQNSDRVLTYLGFNYRKLGNVDLGLHYYRKALAINPDNILVRSYLGQYYAETGAIELARAQLSEIRRRGGRNTWAEFALRMAIDTGNGTNY